jgi:hypothetical protein
VTEVVEIEEVLRNNPTIDPQELRNSMEMLEGLKRRGMSGRGYELVPAFSGKRVQVVDTLVEEGNVRNLNRS